jgi:hypothetical protein
MRPGSIRTLARGTSVTENRKAFPVGFCRCFKYVSSHLINSKSLIDLRVEIPSQPSAAGVDNVVPNMPPFTGSDQA